MILVFGKTGQVATELRALLPDAVFLGRDEADLSDPALCAQKIALLKPGAVINAAAYTAVDKAETDEETAALVNGAAPTEMAKACAALGIPFVHISTDYVFDGSGETPFTPDHPTAPLGAYGRTKLLGENGIRAAGGTCAILRTSWVFSSHGNNFVKTMLRLGAERDKLTIVADQIGGPTPARAIAQACVEIANRLKTEPNTAGTYHFSGAPDVSWADFARAIFAEAGITCAVEDIPSSAYPTPAQRPENSRMDCRSLKTAYGLDRPDWRAAVRTTINEVNESHA
ncbi:MAG: dTDP-4-dehydrorhamnose reductase [Alphaproteobacteria bacterium]|nr:dTDP-4-dehydrorhamnose reductase [Alphaproteobacteria bacterium]MBU1279888.1 dTDP-4-dehydrorhamnose reductase [Alphaproteobacteria bacterium]MBU1572078.1 dTDP-4-dehydrorhamnose reductase [Alphaproteobacteria bacterium]MBU1830414.1 dTDP-4-dehydrorhamnose reductase [Alphaproteobacteria bacterium]MBU2161805.1 dTDP-4-dehydrorhamnose reductase [Alphaproteobacteria bacterium]